MRTINFTAFLACFYLIQLPVSVAFSGEDLKIIERHKVLKQMMIKELTVGEKAEFKDYTTISFFYKNHLIYCHLATDNSVPKLICH